jgi:hypothetical protein
MEKWEQELWHFVHTRHPDLELPMDGEILSIGKIPLAYVEEDEKSKNPNAVFEVDGISVRELSQILDRHRDELRKVAGYAGSGIDKDGICIEVEDLHGTFPDNLEGAEVHLKPKKTRITLGATLTQTQRPIR